MSNEGDTFRSYTHAWDWHSLQVAVIRNGFYLFTFSFACVSATEEKKKERKSVRECDKGRDERGIGGVRGGREDGEEETENN